MAGATTAEHSERQPPASGPPRPPGTGGRPGLRVRRLRVLILLIVVVALLGAGAVWVLYGSQWLRVEKVTTSGTQVLTPGEVREAAAVPVGSPLISVDTDAIEDRLRRKLPRIDSVDVVRSWPHGIALKVTERKPVLLIKKDEKFIEVDAEGVRFATVGNAPKGIPVLELTADQSASRQRFGTDRLVREAVRVAGDVPAAVARITRVVKVRTYDSISLELTGDRTVAWGSSERGRAKAATLSALMKAAPGARHFDVSVPTAPSVSGS
ncbi:FtsQ-type POTRA domain-containing protein [Streptomyces sp. PSKA54]|uniref:Cell division protein FtsQ n=1 Tax=Streptomyces himalayensis subsp. aureolus TaxID=2758039 RepID=A0A7W2CVZ8_9ACTN|nr:FtsQ-type POTRA domain-containing protein [Streptomyces himalayensis]MBA4860121.1 FtsQ-type POTRA domain-containing protein [Streptomyces himalayensis subsp. aureolus]